MFNIAIAFLNNDTCIYKARNSIHLM